MSSSRDRLADYYVALVADLGVWAEVFDLRRDGQVTATGSAEEDEPSFRCGSVVVYRADENIHVHHQLPDGAEAVFIVRPRDNGPPELVREALLLPTGPAAPRIHAN